MFIIQADILASTLHYYSDDLPLWLSLSVSSEVYSRRTKLSLPCIVSPCQEMPSTDDGMDLGNILKEYKYAK